MESSENWENRNDLILENYYRILAKYVILIL